MGPLAHLSTGYQTSWSYVCVAPLNHENLSKKMMERLKTVSVNLLTTKVVLCS